MNTKTKNAQTTTMTSVWISGLNVIAGIWLILAPFMLLYENSTARINDIVLGIVIAVFALIRAFVPSFRTLWLSRLNALWGIWLIIGRSSWVTPGGPVPTTSSWALLFSSWVCGVPPCPRRIGQY
ncbi:MAG: SPW repeat domain-containing protein [Chthoniobacterales bacterium]